MYRPVLLLTCGILHIRFIVGCQMLTLYCGDLGVGALELYPVCPDVDSLSIMCIYSNIFVIGR